MPNFPNKDFHHQLVGVIPCAGYANRVSPLPCSKEIYPVGFYNKEYGSISGPKVISAYLIERFNAAGVKIAHIIIRKGKWDIPNYYGTGNSFGIRLSYIVVNPTKGVSYTVDKAYPFIKDKRVLFGFPDIYFEPEDAYQRLLKHQYKTRSEAVLGLFYADHPRKVDMVEIDNNNRVKNIYIKPEKTNLEYTWMLAVWTPLFSDYLHNYLAEIDTQNQSLKSKKVTGDFKDLHIGYVFQQAINDGLHVNSVIFQEGRYIDIGTLENIKHAAKLISQK